METMENAPVEMDSQKVEAFVGQVVADMAAGMGAMMANVGHKLGLYKAMTGAGPITAFELAQKTGTFERYVQEWLNSQAAGGYLIYDPQFKTYELPAEHSAVLAQENSPVFLIPGFDVISSMWHDEQKLIEAFRNNSGISWHQHHHHLFFGTEAFYRAGYRANLTENWIPGLDGINEILTEGGKVADIGCGHGASTILMAQKYPDSEFFGFDYHAESIEIARKRAQEAGLSNIRFEVATAENFPGFGFDLICFMDAFHDFGDPLTAVAYARQKLSPIGSLMLVEPRASDVTEENFHPLGRMFYSASTALCVPHAHSEDGGYCLGAQAGPGKVEQIIRKAGYQRFSIASQTPVNLIYEAKL